MYFGNLADKSAQAALVHAQHQPEAWQVYLVKTGAEKRTPAQNKFFRSLLRRFAQQNGNSVQFWHDYLVERYLGLDEVVTEDGYVRKVLPSTAELSVNEFSDFLSACLVLAAEHHITV
ncbi:transcription termination/antitermination protein NusG [Novimethylophilus kurashikiensis]|uniref:Transcription termination/antitermination protein NusG n=1 Tax=Novimethylophilus kurashikiensis TaxID=1825523 RepID=A0A2R5FBU1_9PROT|nr:hypothetical protein [Novimethylophilus kurashikiensis]GBG14373.1 transcription termination/antitermination protein NusG [Novimethylophilus kurashikiensis]